MEVTKPQLAIRYTKEAISFIENISNVISINGETWCYMPFWIKILNEDTIQQVSFDKLPEYVKEEIEKQRNDL